MVITKTHLALVPALLALSGAQQDPCPGVTEERDLGSSGLRGSRQLQARSCGIDGLDGILSADGQYCCDLGCIDPKTKQQQCGGTDCYNFGNVLCCTSRIQASGDHCETTKTAPCIIAGPSTLASPTPSPGVPETPTATSAPIVSAPAAEVPIDKPTPPGPVVTPECDSATGFCNTEGVRCCKATGTCITFLECDALTTPAPMIDGPTTPAAPTPGPGVPETPTATSEPIVSTPAAEEPTEEPTAPGPVVTPGQMCTPEVAGYRHLNACCPVSCGQCGGTGCGAQDSGSEEFTASEACCSGAVSNLGRDCSSTVAPCIVSDTAGPSTPASPTPSPVVPETPTATLAPIASTPAPVEPTEEPTTPEPVVTPGPTTSAAPTPSPGVPETSSPTSAPIASTPAPVELTEEPTTPGPVVTPGQMCTPDVAGYRHLNACCPVSCGQCGGTGCGAQDSGSANFTASQACCSGAISNLGRDCSSTVAPCIVSDTAAPTTPASPIPSPGVPETPTATSAPTVSTPAPEEPTEEPTTPGPVVTPGQMCTPDVAGYRHLNACCPVSCGQCGGTGCGAQDSGSEEFTASQACCSGAVSNLGRDCSSTVAPCIVSDTADAAPAPAPTPEHDACNPNPCENGGTCAIDPAGGHHCTCSAGFRGLQCHIETEGLAQFSITLEFNGSVTTEQQEVFKAAADRWAEMISCSPCGSGQILIYASIGEVDGLGNGLGHAGPTSVRKSCPTIPSEGDMTFDVVDVVELEIAGLLEDVILHEMGHVIGIGSLWDKCTTCDIDLSANWTCPAAIGEFNDLLLNPGGDKADIVETKGGPGTACGHLSEAMFGNELMTGSLANEPTVFSKLTAAILEDIGYIIDPSTAEEYRLPIEHEGFALRAGREFHMKSLMVERNINLVGDTGGVVGTVQGKMIETYMDGV